MSWRTTSGSMGLWGPRYEALITLRSPMPASASTIQKIVQSKRTTSLRSNATAVSCGLRQRAGSGWNDELRLRIVASFPTVRAIQRIPFPWRRRGSRQALSAWNAAPPIQHDPSARRLAFLYGIGGIVFEHVSDRGA